MDNEIQKEQMETPKFEDFIPVEDKHQKENIDILMEVNLQVSVELGRVEKEIKEILEFTQGTVVELNREVGDPVDLLVNGKLIAKGEVVVIDGKFGIRIIDIMNTREKL